jgi:hypothetical protein
MNTYVRMVVQFYLNLDGDERATSRSGCSNRVETPLQYPIDRNVLQNYCIEIITVTLGACEQFGTHAWPNYVSLAYSLNLIMHKMSTGLDQSRDHSSLQATPVST